MKERAAYCASKGGVLLLSKAMALDLAPDNIRVNCVCPGAVLTEMMEGILGAAPDPTVALQSRLAQIPLGRMGSPEEVAALVGYLASDEAAWLTGAAIPLDGGVTAY
jgi:NAD(P)-dependent dehydrogenase (short-subunit alcohol dehydrogenase family)